MFKLKTNEEIKAEAEERAKGDARLKAFFYEELLKERANTLAEAILEFLRMGSDTYGLRLVSGLLLGKDSERKLDERLLRDIIVPIIRRWSSFYHDKFYDDTNMEVVLLAKKLVEKFPDDMHML